MSQSTSSKGKISPAAQPQTPKKSSTASGSPSPKKTISSFASFSNYIRKWKWQILGIFLAVFGLLFIIIILLLIFHHDDVPSDEYPELPRGGTRAPPLGPVIHLFGEDLSFPESLYWDDTTRSLYFVDTVAGYFYRWSTRNGTVTYDYSLADFRLIENKLRRTHKDDRPYNLKFIYPFEGAHFYGGFGSALISIKWERPWSNTVAEAHWKAEICEASKEISAGRITPSGSLIFVCKDIEIKNSSEVTFKRFSENRVEDVKLLCFFDSSKAMVEHRSITGMTFDKEGHRLFMVDTQTFAILKWNYAVYNRVEQLTWPELVMRTKARPYDVACDGDNFLWVALIEDNKIIRISTTRIPTQVAQVESYPVPGRMTVGLRIGLKSLNKIIISTGKESPSSLNLKNVENKYSIGGVYFLNKTYPPMPIRHLQRGMLLEVKASTTTVPSHSNVDDYDAECRYI